MDNVLAPGSLLGHFEIVAHIGHGGMGDVYKARDTRLNRIVAIKTSQARFNERFSREARAIAALNHPNIATLYDVGPDYLVMEFVEGEPVKGPLAHEEAITVAKQIVDAIEAAHDKAIIHRDLKPANILRREDGTVKVLDFGLAKALENDEATTLPPGPDSPTLTLEATKLGMILGTAAYMSPEQAKGKRADRRADIFSFGVVLYELLTGKNLFTGESTGEILAAVIKEEAKLDAVPENWRGLLERCLHKDPRQRLQSIGEARILLEKGLPVAERPPAPSRSRFSALAITGWGVAAIALAGLWFSYLRTPASEPQRAMQTQLLPPEGATEWFQVSPDGATLVMSTRAGLWVRSMDSGAAKLIPGTDLATYPFWSPDSRNIAFFHGGKLRRVAVEGGPVTDVCASADSRGGTWSKDGVIVFAPGLSTGLFRVSAGGGTPQIIIKPKQDGSEFIRYPMFLPDGQHILYQHTTSEGSGFYLASLDGSAVKKLAPHGSRADYASGRLLFMVDGTLMSQPFDLNKLELTGEVSPLAERVGQSGPAGNGAYSVSSAGVLVYASNDTRDRQLTWMGRDGKVEGTLPGSQTSLRLSPDGKQLVYSNAGVYLQSVSGGPPTRITEGTRPVWAPSGERIVFTRNLGAGAQLVLKDLSGDAREEPLEVAGQNLNAVDWSADGKWIVYEITSQKGVIDLWILPLEGERKPVPFLESPVDDMDAHFSPDRKWMVYVQGNRPSGDVFVQAISEQGKATGIQYRVSTDGGRPVRWSRDGKELIYATDRQLMAVPVMLGAKIQIGTPHALFERPEESLFRDMTGDAQRFLIDVPTGGASGSNALTVVLNWPSLLK